MTLAQFDPEELVALRDRLGYTPLEIAAVLRIPTAQWRQYEAGRRTVPRSLRAALRGLDYQQRRDALLAERSVEPCHELAALLPSEDSVEDVTSPAFTRLMEAIGRHRDTCPRCLAIQTYLDERLGPRPSLADVATPMDFHWVERLPRRLQPAGYGAAIAFALALMPALGLVVARQGRLAGGRPAAMLLLGAVAAGVTGGLAFQAVANRFPAHPRLGRAMRGIVTSAAVFGTVTLLLLAGGEVGSTELWRDLFLVFGGSLVVGPLIARFLPDPERAPPASRAVTTS